MTASPGPKSLSEVEAAAVELRWSKKRPWKVTSHVWMQTGCLWVDLHDLNASLTRQLVRGLVAEPPDVGAVVFIVGKGKHSLKEPVLGRVVSKELKKACRDHPVWTWRSLQAARIAWVLNPAKAPAAVTGRLGLGCWVMMVGFVGVVLAVLVRALGLV